jgi:hypothetical protein
MLRRDLALATPFVGDHELAAASAATTAAAAKQVGSPLLVDFEDILNREVADTRGKDDEAASGGGSAHQIKELVHTPLLGLIRCIPASTTSSAAAGVSASWPKQGCSAGHSAAHFLDALHDQRRDQPLYTAAVDTEDPQRRIAALLLAPSALLRFLLLGRPFSLASPAPIVLAVVALCATLAL